MTAAPRLLLYVLAVAALGCGGSSRPGQLGESCSAQSCETGLVCTASHCVGAYTLGGTVWGSSSEPATLVVALFTLQDFGPTVSCSRATTTVRLDWSGPSTTPPFSIPQVAPGEWFVVAALLNGAQQVPFATKYVKVTTTGAVLSELGDALPSVDLSMAGYHEVDCAP